jgi:hypothetical protein
VATKVTVLLQTVGAGGGTTQTPLTGVQVRVLDRRAAAFRAIAGKTQAGSDKYPALFEAQAAAVGACTTNSSGECYAGSLTTGDYLVLVRYFDPATGKLIYLGRQIGTTDFVNGLGQVGLKLKKKIKGGVFDGYEENNNVLVIDPS